MGLGLVEKLIDLNENQVINLNIYILNRGKVYWNGKFYDIIENKNFIKHVKVDRNKQNEFIYTIQSLQKEDENPFEYVIEISCFQVEDLKFLDILNYKKYIFISTDSTYNASPIALERTDEYFVKSNTKSIPLITEEYAYLPHDINIRKKLK